MADFYLQAESVCANTTFCSLEANYAMYCAAMAKGPDPRSGPASIISDELEIGNCFAEAIHQLMLFPATNIDELAVKLRIFRDEEISEGWIKASEISVVLADDAGRIATRHGRHGKQCGGTKS